jgi:hypothetical protein
VRTGVAGGYGVRAATAALVVLAALGAALAAPAGAGAASLPAEVRHVRDAAGRVPVDARLLAGPPTRAWAAFPSAQTAAVGAVRNWLALDDARRGYYEKAFTLQAVGAGAEIWVANDLSFPAGDCRNTIQGGSRIRVTPTDAAYLAEQFDRVILPRLTAAFSTPPPRDGTGSPLDPRFDPTGDANRIVVLVDNVRDENYYDRDNRSNTPYIAGFFSRDLTEVFDRNVLTVDSYDWPHRTRSLPPHEPDPNDTCASAPSRPFLYESVLAHEYQHLLGFYQDPQEVDWVDEGLSDWAQTVAGYVDPRRPITHNAHDRHVQCFLGWLEVRTNANPNPRASGPENSLTLWGDAGRQHVLCDYGAAYTFMEFLAGRYGGRFLTGLHLDRRQGLDGLRSVLARHEPRTTVRSLVDDWAAMVALDRVLDRGAALRGGRRAATVRTPTLSAEVNWNASLAFARAGAPPNGSDYVRLRVGRRHLAAGDLRSLAFSAPSPRAFSVQLVAYQSRGRAPAYLARLRLRAGGTTRLDRQALRRLLGNRADVVAAIVTYHDPTESVRTSGRYRLHVNGVRQPGG